ncbi:MAG: efflux RND transporter periplasmic adaptor subunit [Polyangiales bacterium]
MTALQLAAPPEPSEHPELPPRRRRRWPWLFGGFILSALVGGFFWQKQHHEPLAGLVIVEAARGDIENAVTALGKILPRDYVDVGAQVSGQLQRYAVKAGDVVEQGQLLAEIDPQLQLARLETDRAQLAQLEAEREVNRLQVELNVAQFERQIRMKKDGATREDTFERADADVRMAKAKAVSIDAQIRQARSTLKADETLLGYTRIYAPMDGTVVSIDARPGQTLIAVQQVPVLLRIAEVKTMTVWSQVSEADITKLKPNMELYFTTLGDMQRKWPGTLREVLPAPPRVSPLGTSAAQGNIVMYTALFDVDNTQGELLPEMSAQVYFVTGRAANAVLIPVQALKDESDDGTEGTVVVVTDDDELEERTVKLGVRNRFDVEVREGLREGQRLVREDDAPSEPEAPQP